MSNIVFSPMNLSLAIALVLLSSLATTNADYCTGICDTLNLCSTGTCTISKCFTNSTCTQYCLSCAGLTTCYSEGGNCPQQGIVFANGSPPARLDLSMFMLVAIALVAALNNLKHASF